MIEDENLGNPEPKDEKATLISELSQSKIKHSPDEILRIAKLSDGKIVFLEKGKGGKRGSGIKHILENHQQEFATRGISENDLPDAIISAVTQGEIVGHQQPNRPIYQISFNGRTQLIAVTVSDNGYIVCANPASLPRSR
ncbi:MAG: hypothetical protein ACM65K_02990 [Microcoleus sp.]